jgi:glycine cleavage system H lipoate-binding protein
MTTHDFLGLYDAKVAEYLLALAYLLLFVPMWRFVHGGAQAVEARQAAAATEAAPGRAAQQVRGWFHVPEGVALHPGHAWARVEADGLVTIGIDEFAQKLVDPEQVRLPVAGDVVRQSRPAFAVGDQVITVPMLSPVDGTVVAVNERVERDPSALRDPYGAGWLFKVKVAEAGQALRQLLDPAAARAFLESAAEGLSLQLQPALGRVLQDGGAPIHGIAQAVAGEGWAALARKHFLTDRSES